MSLLSTCLSSSHSAPLYVTLPMPRLPPSSHRLSMSLPFSALLCLYALLSTPLGLYLFTPICLSLSLSLSLSCLSRVSLYPFFSLYPFSSLAPPLSLTLSLSFLLHSPPLLQAFQLFSIYTDVATTRFTLQACRHSSHTWYSQLGAELVTAGLSTVATLTIYQPQTSYLINLVMPNLLPTYSQSNRCRLIQELSPPARMRYRYRNTRVYNPYGG